MRQKYIVNGEEKSKDELTYLDLEILFSEYVRKTGKYPTQKECTLQNNLPHFRIVAKILKDENILLKDFQTRMGKIGHIRSNASDYDMYVERFKQKCLSENRTLQISDLTNNTYGLPSAKWFVECCPCDKVKTYNDFVKWCGLPVNTKYDKEYIATKLKDFERELNRSIKGSDIKKNTVGFSMIVINRLWGCLSNAKKEIGLSTEIEDKSLPFDYYRDRIDKTLQYVLETHKRRCVSWTDLETGENKVEHHTIYRAFAKQNIDFNSYLQSKGFNLSPCLFGNIDYFDDGELVRSNFEWDFSCFLRDELKLQYKKDYHRDVMYKHFISDNVSNKYNCDYCLHINGRDYYIEIAGLIYNTKKNNWKEIKYTHKKRLDYQNKMIEKEKLLLSGNINYLFIFQNDMKNERYKDMVKEFIKKGDGYNG